MDVDHVNGIKEVQNAQHIMASKEEIEAGNSSEVRYWKKQWENIRIEPIPFQDTGEGIVGKSWDVYGDGSIKVIATPGHAKGSITVLIQNEEQSILIAGDTGYEKSSWREGRLPGPVDDKTNMMRALEWVKELEKNGTTILARHDPEIEEGVIVL